MNHYRLSQYITHFDLDVSLEVSIEISYAYAWRVLSIGMPVLPLLL